MLTTRLSVLERKLRKARADILARQKRDMEAMTDEELQAIVDRADARGESIGGLLDATPDEILKCIVRECDEMFLQGYDCASINAYERQSVCAYHTEKSKGRHIEDGEHI